jgi:hypothetical protein
MKHPHLNDLCVKRIEVNYSPLVSSHGTGEEVHTGEWKANVTVYTVNGDYKVRHQVTRTFEDCVEHTNSIINKTVGSLSGANER